MDYFSFKSYKKLLLWLIDSRQLKRGVFKQIAECLSVQPVIISQKTPRYFSNNTL